MGDKAEDRIKQLKEELGNELIILGHHYQREGVVRLSDVVGDSYFLAKSSRDRKEARFIVFCGVRFMAEAARILCDRGQKVIHPDPDAGCPLADMASLDEVKVVWEELRGAIGSKDVLPLTYINSSADLKAFCGMNGGLVCTSSNAQRAMKYGFEKASVLFFFPDQHLGRNTAASMGIPEDEILLWRRDEDMGGNSAREISRAKIILWDGFCHVHTHFKVDDVKRVRRLYPDIKVIVHPECEKEVVDASDEAGSTSFIVNYVKKAPNNATIAVGTEINLVSRIAKENPNKRVFELKRSLCPNMYKISEQKLLASLENRDKDRGVILEDEVISQARLALSRMLEV